MTNANTILSNPVVREIKRRLLDVVNHEPSDDKSVKLNKIIYLYDYINENVDEILNLDNQLHDVLRFKFIILQKIFELMTEIYNTYYISYPEICDILLSKLKDTAPKFQKYFKDNNIQIQYVKPVRPLRRL